MPIPDFIVDLRRHIGHELLWLTGVTAVVEDDGRVLLVRRADDGEWSPVTGIVDPGEQPADAAVREVAEEAGVAVAAERLAGIDVTGVVTYDGGDRSQYLDLIFRCRYLGGEPAPLDGEATDARWFPLDQLPPMNRDHRKRLATGLADRATAHFIGGEPKTSGPLPGAPAPR